MTTADPILALPKGPSIAVLPFTNLGGDPAQDYFSDGLTEELIHLLTRIPRFRVVAWATASQLRGREEDLAGISQQLQRLPEAKGGLQRAGVGVEPARRGVRAPPTRP